MRIILYSLKAAKSELSSVITKFIELIKRIVPKTELTYNIETFHGYKASVNAQKEEMKTLRASMRTLSEKFDKMDNYSLSEKFDKMDNSSELFSVAFSH